MPHLRVLHASESLPPVDIYVNDDLIFNNLSYGEITSYANVKYCRVKISVHLFEGDKLVSKIYSLSRHSTLTLSGSVPQLKVFADELEIKDEGHCDIRFVQLSNSVNSASLHLDNVPVIGDVAYLESKTVKIKLGSPFHLLQVYVNGPVSTEVINPPNRSVSTTYMMGSMSNLKVLTVNSEGTDLYVKDFNPVSYMGHWILQAEIPQPYISGLDCKSQTADYTLLNSKVKVYNRCYNEEGKMIDSITGSATIPNICNNAALIVNFPNIPYQSTDVNYLVQEVKYTEYAIVGSPNRSSYYLLTRNKCYCKCLLRRFFTLGKELGYNTSKIVVY